MRQWLITGASSGLGRALAQAVVARGETAIGTLRSLDAAEAFAALDRQRAHPFILDVSDAGAVVNAVTEAERRIGPLDVVVNNAGYSFSATVEEADLADIRAQFETNFFGALHVTRATLPSMRRRRRGHILNVSSLAGFVTPGGIGFYGASKLALESLSEALAEEVEPFGIRVTIVIPGAFRTELGRSRRTASASISDYAVQNKERNDFLEAYSGSQRGDPRKAAEAMIAAVESRASPRRLLLGPDALEAFRTKLAVIGADMEAWEPVSKATDLSLR